MFVQDEIERQGSVLVDYSDLIGDGTVREALPDIKSDLKEQPEVMLSCLGVAIHQVNRAVTTLLQPTANNLKIHSIRHHW